jgi:integrase/recombinase XerD
MATEGLASNPQGVFNEALRKNSGGCLHPPSHCDPKLGRKQERLFSQEQEIPPSRDIFDPGERFQWVLIKLRAMEIPGKDLVELYLRDQYRRNLRLRTIQNSMTTITSFLKLAMHSGKNQLATIGRKDLAVFIEHEQDRGSKASTVKNRLDILKAFLRYLIEKEVVGAEVLFKKMVIKVPDFLPRAIETEDERKLLSVIDNARNRAMVLLLLRTGMRIGELLNTQVRDINLKEFKIEIWEAPKNRVGRVVYFTEDSRKALVEWLGQRDFRKDYVFYAPNRKTLTYDAARCMFCKYLAKAGLAHKGYTLHCLRHTNASALLNAGMPLECLKELLGHTSVEVTRRYARLTNKTREKEYFKAMARIEKGEINGYYRLDLELQEILEKEKLLSPHGEKLHEQS